MVADARDRMPVDEMSIGDYVLSGGEPAVLVMIDAITRLLPGVLGNAGSAADDSFGGGGGPMAGLLEGPSYTRPRVWRGARCRLSCCPATTAPSPAGGAMRRCAGPPRSARIWSPGWLPGRWTGATGRSSWTLAFRSAPKNGTLKSATHIRPTQRVRVLAPAAAQDTD